MVNAAAESVLARASRCTSALDRGRSRLNPLRAAAATAVAVVSAGLAGCGPLAANVDPLAATPPTPSSPITARSSTHSDSRETPTAVAECARDIPKVGRHSAPPPSAEQAIIVAGQSATSTYSTVTTWQRESGCWTMLGSWPGRNGAAGWHPHPWDGSGYSPIGVFGLSDAGGRLPNPGTKLPYHESRSAYTMAAPKAHVFDYVIAINFNRYVGRAPADLGRPDPAIPDGGIWLHVSRGEPTRGCISLPSDQVVEVLRWIDPARHPVIIMGPVSALAR